MTRWPHCDAPSDRQVKFGLNRTGSQRYLCRVCRRTYTPAPQPRGYSEEMKREALELYASHYRVRYIARLFTYEREIKLSPQTILNWMDAACRQARDSGAPIKDEVLEAVMERREQQVEQLNRRQNQVPYFQI